MSGERWNSNLHAFDRLLERIPPAAIYALDVGCGEGETARRLRKCVSNVVGLDADARSIEQARLVGDDITYVEGDLFTTDLAEGSFDVITAVVVLHHVDHRAGLCRLRCLVRPGGMLLVVGLARSRTIADYAKDVVDTVAVRRYSRRRDVWETPAPKLWPPPLTYAEARRASVEALPGVCFERLPFLRYGLTWTRPPESSLR